MANAKKIFLSTVSLFLIMGTALSLYSCTNSVAETSKDDTSNLSSTTELSDETTQEAKPLTENTAEEETVAEIATTEEETTAEEITTVEETITEEETESQPKTTMTRAQFNELLSDLPVSIIDTKYTVQDNEYKSLYPDLLKAILKNNTNSDIKDAVIAFVAWDKNNLPVKIKGSSSYSDGEYIVPVDYDDINLIPGDTYGESSGFGIDEKCIIDKFEAICVSFETFYGQKWSNPYYDEWCTLYEGVKLTENLTVDVIIEDSSFDDSNNIPAQSNIDEKALLEKINAQEVHVISTEYTVQDDKYKNVYPDLIQAIFVNNSEHDIKNAVIAFVAWDKNGLPVKIKGKSSYNDPTYIIKVNYGDINMIPGSTYGESSGYGVDERCGINKFNAIVVSYEAFDGENWSNPLYDDWCELYEGRVIK